MCCIDCKDRFPGCHSLCEAYKAKDSKRKERNNAIYQARIVEKIADSVQINNVYRTKARINL